MVLFAHIARSRLNARHRAVGALKGNHFVVFIGYMDESSKNDEWFILSVIIAYGGEWQWIVWAWEKMLEGTNRILAAQGRRTLSRYKAADCSSCEGEFRGWTKEEQIALTKKIISIFNLHRMRVVSYSVNLRELVHEIPETKADPKGFAYVLLLHFLLPEIWDLLKNENHLQPSDRVALIHDRCEYDAALLDAFNQMKDDDGFEHRDRFTTIAPMGWEECIPLQPADLLAYENLREAELKSAGKKRRKTLELLLDLNTFGGCAKGINAEILRKLWNEKLYEGTKEILLRQARIKCVRNPVGETSSTTTRRKKGNVAGRKR